jgi:hypothetical protein
VPVFGATERRNFKMVSATIALVRGPMNPSRSFHAQNEGANGVRIAADFTGHVALGEAGFFVLKQGAQDGELVGCNANGRDAAAESLVQTVPGVPEQNGHAAARGSVDR